MRWRSRWNKLCSAWFIAAALLSVSGCSSPQPAQPNVVLIVIDTLRADRLGCYGHPSDASAAIDELAREGVRFDRAIAQSSWTRSSLGSLVTSRLPRSLGIYKEQWDALDPSHETLAEVLSTAGYATFGATANPNTNEIFGFAQGFDRYIDSVQGLEWVGAVGESDFPMPTADQIFGQAEAWVEQLPAGPAYLELNVMEVHEHWRYEQEEGQESRYLQAIREVATAIDCFVATLLARPGWDDTLIVIASDHGEGLDSHPGVRASAGHGRLLYESQLRVPLILHHPTDATLRGQVVERPVRLMDLAPTILDYLELPIPAAFDGRSLLQLLGESPPSQEKPDLFFVETEFRDAHKVGIYTDRWRYIENRDGHPGLSDYELQAAGGGEDGPRTDRASANPQISQELHGILQQWERQFPRVAPSPIQDEAVDSETLEQLKSLGYVQ